MGNTEVYDISAGAATAEIDIILGNNLDTPTVDVFANGSFIKTTEIVLPAKLKIHNQIKADNPGTGTMTTTLSYVRYNSSAATTSTLTQEVSLNSGTNYTTFDNNTQNTLTAGSELRYRTTGSVLGSETIRSYGWGIWAE